MPEVYVARKRLKVGDHFVLPGEEVPEAAAWRNLHSYIASGAVRLVQTDLVQAYAMTQEIPHDAPFDWKERPRNRRGKGALKPWVDYGQSGELPEPPEPPEPEVPAEGDLSMTFPDSINVTNNSDFTEFATVLANSGAGAGDGYTGRWTISLGEATITADEVVVNMVDFNGPGEDVLIDFADADGQIVGIYGPFPIAANMSGQTTDQISIQAAAPTIVGSGVLAVSSEILDSTGTPVCSAGWTINFITAS